MRLAKTPPPPHSDVAGPRQPVPNGCVSGPSSCPTPAAPHGRRVSVSRARRRPPVCPNNCARPPVECWRGTSPNHAANSRPLRNVFTSPTAATNAVAVIGPIPGIPSNRCTCSSALAQRSILAANASAARPSVPASHRHPLPTRETHRLTRSRHPPRPPATPPAPGYMPWPISIPCSASNPRT